MTSISDKLRDPNLPEDDQDVIFGAFVRQYENKKLKARWGALLEKEQNIKRQTDETRRFPPLRKLWLPLLAVAASLLLLLNVLPSLIWPDGQQLLASQIEAIEIETSRSTVQTPAEQLRTDFGNAFRRKEFNRAETIGTTLISLPTATEKDQLNLGLAHLQAKNYGSAIRQFQTLAQADRNFFTEANYYLGVSLLSAGNVAEGLNALREIKETDGALFFQDAQQLLQADWAAN